jgi:hypothetical protein
MVRFDAVLCCAVLPCCAVLCCAVLCCAALRCAVLCGLTHSLPLHADQWDVQAAIQRVNESLIDRGYVTWFDLTNMKGEYAAAAALLLSLCPSERRGVCVCTRAGSTMDAMSDAIEGADVMLYGVSLRYKESANVRKATRTVLSMVSVHSCSRSC